MKRYVFKNVAEWVVTNEKGAKSEQLFTGLKVYTGNTEASALYFQRPFYCKINDRYLFIRQHPNKRNDALTIPLNQIAHSDAELKALLLGATDVSAEITALQAQVATIEGEADMYPLIPIIVGKSHDDLDIWRVAIVWATGTGSVELSWGGGNSILSDWEIVKFSGSYIDTLGAYFPNINAPTNTNGTWEIFIPANTTMTVLVIDYIKRPAP